MEIHKPKPWHGYREFAKELGTITAGILIALALEQLAEHLRWERAVDEARTAIHEEIAFNNGYLQTRAAGETCVTRRLDEIDRAVTTAEPNGRLEPVPGAALSLSAQISDAQWQTARSAQTLAHFPHDELAELGRYYDTIGTMKTVFFRQEGDDWRWLADLQTGPHRATPSDLAQLRYHLRGARWLNTVLANGSRRLVETGKKLGVKSLARDDATLQGICRGMPVDQRASALHGLGEVPSIEHQY